jgi:hypothetical protein
MSLRIDFWNELNNKQAAKNQQYKSLFQSLQAIHPGSVLLLRAPSDEPWLGQLIKRGQLFSRKNIKSFRGSRKRCHQNASCIWIMDQGLIGTGFGYTRTSPQYPGAWYRHSWGLDYSTKMPRVIETTHKFKDYYGVELDDDECKCFVLQNVLPMLNTLIEKIYAT